MDFAKSPSDQDTVVVAVSIVFFIVRAEDRKKRRSKLTRLDCYYLEMLSRGPYFSIFRHYSHVRHNSHQRSSSSNACYFERSNHKKKRTTGRNGEVSVRCPEKGFHDIQYSTKLKTKNQIFECWDSCRRSWPYQKARVWRSVPGTLRQSCHIDSQTVGIRV